MPIYEFACAACGHHFERLQKLSDADPTACPQCAAAQVRRQLTAPAFRLAGGGWYETDFKKEGDKKRNLADKASGSDSTGSDSAAKDTASKPEPATAPVSTSSAASTQTPSPST